MAVHNPSALCQDTFHSSRQVQLHCCSYSCLKGKVSSQQDLGQLRATETQHPQPTDCSAGLNPEPITGRCSCSCPQHLQTTPETSAACAWVWRNGGAGKAGQARPGLQTSCRSPGTLYGSYWTCFILTLLHCIDFLLVWDKIIKARNTSLFRRIFKTQIQQELGD